MGPNFFRTLGVPIIAGRDFADSDTATSPHVGIVNEEFAKRFLPNQNPLGHTTGLDNGQYTMTIVGVVKNHKYRSIDEEPIPMAWYMYAQLPIVGSMDVEMRVHGKPLAILPSARKAVQQLDLSLIHICFDTVVDIGCFHSLYNDGDRAAYATTLHRVCRAGAVVYLRAFSETNLTKANYPIGEGLPALREEQIRTAFSLNGWVVKDLVEREIELYISEDEKPRTYCWFAEMHMREEFYGTDIVL